MRACSAISRASDSAGDSARAQIEVVLHQAAHRAGQQHLAPGHGFQRAEQAAAQGEGQQADAGGGQHRAPAAVQARAQQRQQAQAEQGAGHLLAGQAQQPPGRRFAAAVQQQAAQQEQAEQQQRAQLHAQVAVVGQVGGRRWRHEGAGK